MSIVATQVCRLARVAYSNVKRAASATSAWNSSTDQASNALDRSMRTSIVKDYGDTNFITGMQAFAPLAVAMIHTGGGGFRALGEVGRLALC